jgi:hypothetical protein
MSWFNGDLLAVAEVPQAVLQALRESAELNQPTPVADKALASTFGDTDMFIYRQLGQDVVALPKGAKEWIAAQLGMLLTIQLVRTPPGNSIHRHFDTFHNLFTCARYHIVLSEQVSWTTIGEVAYPMYPGILYRYNNRKWHYASNPAGAPPRIHLMLDPASQEIIDGYKKNPASRRVMVPLQPWEIQ